MYRDHKEEMMSTDGVGSPYKPESAYMNELLERIGSDVRAIPCTRVGPTFYSLLSNILDRLDQLEHLNELGRHHV